MTHDLGNPAPYRHACRELYRHAYRLRYAQPIPPTPRRHAMRWVLLGWVVAILLLLAMSCTFGGW